MSNEVWRLRYELKALKEHLQVDTAPDAGSLTSEYSGEGESQARVAEIAVPVFGTRTFPEIDHRHGFIVTDAAAHDGHQVGQLLDPHNTAGGVSADTSYRSQANVALLARRGLVPQFQRPKPCGKPMLPQIARGNARRARVRVAIEHVFAAQKCRLGLVSVRSASPVPPPGSASPTWSLT